MKVMIDQTEARSQGGFFRVDRSYGTTRVGVYRGAIELSAPGSTDVNVKRLRQAEISANQLYPVEPYQLGDDSWDAAYLEPLFDVNEDIAQLRDAFSNQLGRDLPTLEYFGAMVDNKNVSFMRPYAAKQSPKDPDYTVDLLIGLSLAEKASGGLGNSFEKGFGFYEQGATWGVVAGILGVGSPKQLDSMVAALTKTFSGSVAGGDSGDVTFAVSESGELLTTAGEVPGGGPGDSPSNPSDPTDPTDPSNPNDPNDPNPPDDPPTDGPSEEPPSECDAQCELQKTIDDATAPPEPSPSPSSLFDPPPIRN